jgi:hypothetical protein
MDINSLPTLFLISEGGISQPIMKVSDIPDSLITSFVYHTELADPARHKFGNCASIQLSVPWDLMFEGYQIFDPEVWPKLVLNSTKSVNDRDVFDFRLSYPPVIKSGNVQPIHAALCLTFRASVRELKAVQLDSTGILTRLTLGVMQNRDLGGDHLMFVHRIS